MIDRHDILRHGRVAQHASARREQIHEVPDAPGTSGQASRLLLRLVLLLR